MPILNNNLNEYKFYLNQLSVTTGNIYDLERDFLFSELSVTSGNTHDLWKTWLIGKSVIFTNIYDSWRDYLVGLGYSGNLQDMQNKYFEDNS